MDLGLCSSVGLISVTACLWNISEKFFSDFPLGFISEMALKIIINLANNNSSEWTKPVSKLKY